MRRPRHIRLQAFTRSDRNEVISRLRDAFQGAGADLIDHKVFSNTAINISFELAGNNLARLGEALAVTGVSLDEESLRLIAEAGEIDEPVTGNLSVTFIHNGPDLLVPVPPIPG